MERGSAFAENDFHFNHDYPEMVDSASSRCTSENDENDDESLSDSLFVIKTDLLFEV